MPEEEVTKKEIAQEIGRAMVETAKKLAHHGDSRSAAAGLKDLAEAYAWLNYPNQTH